MSRFTDAELAAEYWAAFHVYGVRRLTSQALELSERIATFQRFAQHAHFDEVT